MNSSYFPIFLAKIQSFFSFLHIVLLSYLYNDNDLKHICYDHLFEITKKFVTLSLLYKIFLDIVFSLLYLYYP